MLLRGCRNPWSISLALLRSRRSSAPRTGARMSSFNIRNLWCQPVADLETYMGTLKTKKEQAEGWLKWVDSQKEDLSADCEHGTQHNCL